ncbi:serine hydrolase domain-containing protein [Sinomicrobium weinanense]|uniref:Beta-lactamase family protein n=1 Tax=Sinomicrobium weinanense TaxID=2842200 RepID=A0A926JRG9_9FLAO|nr:serine hydrolase domain-containing protein [Sinomicrobium weinanense]MBC9796145.1 beta-lactamase family protein [Sinomicrobium weinanense]MBU3121896.1 beta-lactamase family protein [Sinomicrobium weinanense]
MKKILYNLIILISGASLFFTFTGCTSVQKRQKEVPVFVNDSILDKFFTTLYQKKMFNGAVAVKKNGSLIFKKGYGTANMEKGSPFTPHTAMEIASVSKQFTAAAVQLLQQENKLDIDHSVQTYLGDDFPYPEITVKHLLTHTSGLPDYEDHFRKHWDTTRIARNSDILSYFKKKRPALISKPGVKYHYSNSGYVLLAEIVHAVSGNPLNTFLRENIFDKAGMADSGFYERDSIWEVEDYAPGYRIDPATCTYVRPETLPGKYYYRFLSGRLGPGRLSSSVNDLIKWDSILYTDELLNAQSKKVVFQPYPPTDDDSDYGFGWHVQQDDSIGKIVYHTGSWAANLSYIKRFTDTKSLVVILNNTFERAYIKEIRAAVDDYIKGKPLKLPQTRAADLLQKEICRLNPENITDWQKKNRNADWDTKDLRKLEMEYRENGETVKTELIAMLLRNIKQDSISP